MNNHINGERMTLNRLLIFLNLSGFAFGSETRVEQNPAHFFSKQFILSQALPELKYYEGLYAQQELRQEGDSSQYFDEHLNQWIDTQAVLPDDSVVYKFYDSNRLKNHKNQPILCVLNKQENTLRLRLLDIRDENFTDLIINAQLSVYLSIISWPLDVTQISVNSSTRRSLFCLQKAEDYQAQDMGSRLSRLFGLVCSDIPCKTTLAKKLVLDIIPSDRTHLIGNEHDLLPREEYQKIIDSEELGITQFESISSKNIPGVGLLFLPSVTVPFENHANCGMICALRQLYWKNILEDVSKDQIGTDKRQYPSRLGLSPTTVHRSSLLSSGFFTLACAATYSYVTGDVRLGVPLSSLVLAGLCHIPKLATTHNILGSLPHVLKEDIKAYRNVNCELEATWHSFSRHDDFLQFLQENKGKWFIVLIYASKLNGGHYVNIMYQSPEKIVMDFLDSHLYQITEEELVHLVRLDTWKRQWYYHLVKWFDPSFSWINCIEIQTNAD